MNTFEKIQKVLSSKIVGIAGCGGLGSNCAVALARIGVGTIIIADFDVIEESNLNRQYYFYNQIGKKKTLALKENIEKINPKVRVVAYDIKLDSKSILNLFSGCDVIVEAFDKAEMKQMIIETIMTDMPEKPLVCGVGMAGWGDSNSMHVRQFGNIFFCGDGKTEASEKIPPLAPRVSIAAGMEANTVLAILLKDEIELSGSYSTTII
ncbi:MAG: sulfur carrier protein ThiS adenylyltransferase ThiF [Bacteroidia bacterium]|nr:sulfur carrier protein ThiS adenylyltransferase ThiF [Bacteroidia bacterium]